VIGGRLDGEALYYLARSYARLGDTAQALTLLERSVAGGFSCYHIFVSDQWLAPSSTTGDSLQSSIVRGKFRLPRDTLMKAPEDASSSDDGDLIYFTRSRSDSTDELNVSWVPDATALS